MCERVRVCGRGTAYFLTAEIAALCPNLSALFLPTDCKVTEAGLTALRQSCPGVRVSVLGRQISREQLLSLLRNYNQTWQLNLILVHTYLTDAGLSELAALCPLVDAVLTRPGSQITRKGLQAMKAACPAALCVQLGHEIDERALETLQAQYRDHRVLDLSDAALFGSITHAGLAELPRLFPDVEAIFSTPASPGAVGAQKLQKLKDPRTCPKLWCVDLGRAIDFAAYEVLITQCSSRRLDLQRHRFKFLGADGLMEIVQRYPDLETIFSSKKQGGGTITAQVLQQLKIKCRSCRCAVLGQEVTAKTYEELQAQYRDHRVLDLSDAALFGSITHAGLAELPRLFPDVEAIFSTPASPGAVGAQKLQKLKDPRTCPKLWCVDLGRAIDFAAYEVLITQCSSRRLDLQRHRFKFLGADGLMEIVQRYPDLETIFSSKKQGGGTITAKVLQQLRIKYPSCRCAVLGQEVTAKTYEELEQQFEATGMLDLTVAGCEGISDTGLAELVHIPGVCTGLEAIFTDALRISADALSRLKQACSWAQCVLLGQEIDPATFVKLREGYRQTKQLDLSDAAAFSRLTVAGLGEIVSMFPDTKALVDAAKHVSSELSAFLLQEMGRLMSAQQSGTASGGRPLRLPMKAGKTLAADLQDSTFVKLGSLKMALDAKYPARFNLEEILGIGGSGLVVRARDKMVGKVAIKVVTPQVTGVTFTEKERMRLGREIATMQRARHGNVCACHESFFSDDGSMCVMVLEYLNGKSLEEMVVTSSHGGSRVPLQEVEVLRIMLGCLEGLRFVHGQKLVHRDLKPGNIVGHELPEGGTVYKIIDFGLAMASDEDEGATVATMMKTGSVHGVGTPHLMSPEQWGGDDVTPLSDIYSLGATMFFLLSGQYPFAHSETKMSKILSVVCSEREAPDLRAVCAAPGLVGDRVAEVVAKALRKEAEERFASAGEMLGAVSEAMTRRGYARYDAMISYRARSEKSFALALFERMSRESITLPGGGTRRMRVYLDRARLEDGERWDEGFVLNGVAASTVVVPLVSAAAMEGLSALAQTDKIDWLLLEWLIAMALHGSQADGPSVAKVFPILLGKRQADGTRTDFWTDGSSAQAASLPSTPSAMTHEQAQKMLAMIDRSLTLPEQSVRQAFEELLRYQALNVGTQGRIHGDHRDPINIHDAAAVEVTMEKLVPIVGATVLGAVRCNDAPRATAEPPPGLEAELRQLPKRKDLVARARREGVDEDELDDAESKEAIIQLILGSPLKMSAPR
eukprot:SAG25_NODE_89_length_16305_cov_24.431630_2_plen_1259_part_00